MIKAIPFICHGVNDSMRQMAKLLGDKFVYVGEANGYVAIPPDHPFYGLGIEDDKVQSLTDLGISYAGMYIELFELEQIEFYSDERPGFDWWVFGFDTMYRFRKDWTKQTVYNKAKELAQRLNYE